MTADESAAVALAFAALRAQAAAAIGGARPASRWSSTAPRDVEPFGSAARVRHDRSSGWVAAARLEALRDDVR